MAMSMAATQRITTKQFEKRMERRRLEETQHNLLRKQHRQNLNLLANGLSEERVEHLRRQRQYQAQNRELQQGFAYENARKEREQRKLISEQNAQLAAAIYDMKTQKMAEDIQARRICDESEELSKLKQQLKMAQMNKIRATQMAEKEALMREEAQREAAIDAMMEEDRRGAVDRNFIEAQRKQFLVMQQRQILQDQMSDREYQKQRAYEEFLKEKAMVDEVVRGIEAEDQAKNAARLKKQKQLQENIRGYLEERRLWREEEKRRAQEELKRIQDYNTLQQTRHSELMKQKQVESDRNDAVLAKLTKEIEDKAREEAEMERLLYELYQEEAEAKALEQERQRLMKKQEMKQEMIEANEFQKMLKAQRLMEQHKEEEEFRTKMMKKFAEDKRLAQMNAERRKREMMDYKLEVERLIQERKDKYERAVEAELEERRLLAQEEEFKKRIVERERQRLLREYAPSLGEYLPKGVFRSADDYKQVFGREPRHYESHRARNKNFGGVGNYNANNNNNNTNMNPNNAQNGTNEYINNRRRNQQPAVGILPGGASRDFVGSANQFERVRQNRNRTNRANTLARTAAGEIVGLSNNVPTSHGPFGANGAPRKKISHNKNFGGSGIF